MAANKIDAAADSMKAELNAVRRKVEADGYELLCATCDAVAASGSCYCDGCEAREFGDG